MTLAQIKIRVSEMVGMMKMAMSLREKAATLLHSAKFFTEIPTKLDNMRQLKELLLNRDPSLLPEFVPLLFELQTDRASPRSQIPRRGLHSSELDDSLVSSWACILKLKDKIQPVAFQGGSDGIRLLAVKFVEAIILLYTPDPNGSSQPPPHQDADGKILGFNMSWLCGGHPVLNLGDLATEASKSLGLCSISLGFRQLDHSVTSWSS